MPTRRHVHTRSIRAEVYVRDDGLWEVEAELVDTKSRDFPLSMGVRPAGEPVHHMRITLTIDAELNVLESEARSLSVPYPGYCEAIAPAYGQLVGLNLRKDFRRRVRERLGGTAGCTHITELTGVLPTAAIQAMAGEIIRNRDTQEDDGRPAEKPFQLDRCHALRTDGPAVARFYPRWVRPAAVPPSDTNQSTPTLDEAT